MANIEQLTKLSELSFTRWQEFDKGKREHQSNLRFDDVLDTLMILFVDPSTETTVHYIDDQVALLYDTKSNEVVGVQIENFKAFAQAHLEVNNAWRLKDCCNENDIKDFGDLAIHFEAQKPQVAREVIRVTEDMVFGKCGKRARLPQMA